MPGDIVVIHTSTGTCGKGFVPGEDYLIYAYADKEGKLYTGQCTRTRSLSDAEEDIHFLRAYSGPRTTTEIKGDVQQVVGYSPWSPRSAAFRKHRQLASPQFEPVAGVELDVTRKPEGREAGETFRVRTDTEGEFELVDPKPGTYAAQVVAKAFISVHTSISVSERGSGLERTRCDCARTVVPSLISCAKGWAA